MLSKLGYFKGPATGQMDINTHAALSKFQADEDLIATGDLNFDTYERLVQKFNGYPVNGHTGAVRKRVTQKLSTPRISFGKGLTLVSTKRNFHLNDGLSLKLNVKTSGYLYCFYQSGTAGVIQVLPKAPNIRLRVPAGYTRTLPDTGDGFTLKFETPQNTQRVLCAIQKPTENTASPFDGKFKLLKPLPVKKLETIPSKFIDFGGLTGWVMVSKTAMP